MENNTNTNIQNKVQGLFKSMSIGQMLSIGVSISAILFLAFIIMKWSTRPDYAILFSNLDLKDSDSIVQTLAAQGVPHKLSGGGTAVMVPSKDIPEWRMKLASQGLPTSGTVGYEIFDKNDLGISDFVQKVNYIRALEGELSRTVMGIGSIRNARVHIVVPKDRLFMEDQKEPSASIILNLQGNQRLQSRQIDGITNLVAASVEGLTPEHVTIVDSHGNILSKPWEDDSFLGLSSNQMEIQRSVESHLAGKAESMLAGVLGVNKAIVRVTAELNFQRIERTDERYDPDNAAVLSEEISGESNVDSSGNQTGQTEKTMTNYQVPKTIEHVTNSIGDINRLSVAVLVDGQREKVTADDGSVTWNYTARSTDEMETLSAIVMNAVGYDEGRNDQFTIRNIPFEQNEAELLPPLEEPLFTKEMIFDYGQKALPVIFLIVLLLVVKGKLKKAKFKMVPPSKSGASPTGNSMLPAINPNVTRDSMENANMAQQLAAFAEEKPAQVANLLRYWLTEE